MPAPNPDLRKEIASLYNSGWPVRKIAAAHNLSTQAVYHHLHVAGIRPSARKRRNRRRQRKSA